jgi:hypothetical protein
MIRAALLLALLGQGMPAVAADPEQRPFRPDRPDETDSPFTVEPGSIQIETNFALWARTPRGDDGTRGTRFEAGETNLRVGLTPRLEANITVVPWGRARESAHAPWRSGAGALTIGAKYNFFGNDSKTTALGVFPFVSIPLDRSSGIGPEDVEYGVLVPYAAELGDKLSIGVNAGLTLRRPEAGAAYRASVPLAASLEYEATDKLSAFYELAGEVVGGGGDELSANTGVMWQVADNIQIDAALFFGLNGATEPVTALTGIAVRF